MKKKATPANPIESAFIRLTDDMLRLLAKKYNPKSLIKGR